LLLLPLPSIKSLIRLDQTMVISNLESELKSVGEFVDHLKQIVDNDVHVEKYEMEVSSLV
jgi:hypothetical protein